MDAQIRAQVATELEAIPRGTLAQNICRIQTVRQDYPDFTPIRDIRRWLDASFEPERSQL